MARRYRFSELMEEIREEARRTGTEKDLEALQDHFRLARQLSRRRLALGLSQKELARRTGVDQSEISRMESGSANPTVRTLSTVAAALQGRLRVVFPSRRQERRARRSPKRR